jgi:hypothetical protein
MFVRAKRFPRPDGSVRTYLDVVVNRRVDGRVRQEVVAHLGRLETLIADGAVDRLVEGLARYSRERWFRAEALRAERAATYGPVLVFRRLWEELGLAEQLTKRFAGTDIAYAGEEAVFAMALNRILEPHSKRGTRTWMETVHRPEWTGLELHHLYRALDVLAETGPEVEEALFARVRDLFHLDLTLMLFDTTSVYLEGEHPEGLAEFGYSRDHRPDRRQVVVGLLMTREGIPVCHRVFPGNTVDARAFQAVLKELKPRFGIERVVLVGDRGLVTEETLEELDRQRIGYILGMPLRRYARSQEVLARAGRYHHVADNLEVKEVWLEGERFVLCRNPEAAERDRQRREEIVEALRERLTTGGVGALLKSLVYRRFLTLQAREASIDPARVAADARLDGKWVLTTSTVMPSDELALAYKGLWRIERAFRQLKSGLDVRPVFHWTTPRVRAHILVCFLALVLESALQRRLAESSPEVSYSQVRHDLDQLCAVLMELDGERYLVRTELQGNAHAAFQAVGMRPPARIQPLD